MLTIIEVYVIIVAVELRLMNQFRTTADAVLHVKNASAPSAVDTSNAGIGTPFLVVLAKILGARPCFARPKRVLDAWKRRQLVQLQPEVILRACQCIFSQPVQVKVMRSLESQQTYMMALQRSGKNFIRSRFMAMMKGDLTAPFPDAIAVTVNILSTN